VIRKEFTDEKEWYSLYQIKCSIYYFFQSQSYEIHFSVVQEISPCKP